MIMNVIIDVIGILTCLLAIFCLIYYLRNFENPHANPTLVHIAYYLIYFWTMISMIIYLIQIFVFES